jgi:hypothetical protein
MHDFSPLEYLDVNILFLLFYINLIRVELDCFNIRQKQKSLICISLKTR